MLRNIHFESDDSGDEIGCAPPAPAPQAARQVAAGDKLRIRHVTVSPLQEYAMRPGEVRPISDSLAALICSRKGRAQVGPKGVTIDRKDIGGVRVYHHVDSIVCNDLSQRERKLWYVLNSLRPDIVHILDERGCYIESLPEKFKPAVLNNEEQARELADQKRQFNRLARRMQDLHGDDTKKAIEDLRANNVIAQRIVQVMPSNSPSPANAPAPSALGDRILAGERRINDARKQDASALRIGRALATTRVERFAPEPASSRFEDWSGAATESQQPSNVEQW